MAEESSGTMLARVVLRTQSDASLVALTRDGHDAAYEEIVRRYRPRLVRQAAAIAASHRAEDVVQESLARALDAIRSSDADLALGAWLATIVRNRSLNDLRDEPGPHDELDSQYDGVPQPPQVAAQRQDVRDVVLAINSLPDQQRRALVGRELEGLSHDQIAAELGVSPAGARGLIFRARAGLREALGALIPLPVVRFLLETGAAEATGGAAAGTGALIAGSSAGTKTAVGILAILATVGSGVAVERKLSDRQQTEATTAEAASPDRGELRDPGGSRTATGSGFGSGQGGQSASGDDGREDGGGASSGEGPADDGDNSGPGGDGREPEREVDSSGPGSGEEPDGERSGSGSGEEPATDDHSGPGGGGDEPVAPEPPDDDNSGPGGGELSGDSSGSGSGEPDDD